MFYEKIELNLEAVHSTGQNCKFYRSIFGFSEDRQTPTDTDDS